ncbi:helix-turn-helix domain-containing protein [Thermoactinospora rubra]|uniref:helix-turn-helix domain-containing protein n=1 Tax=Thermoactinospora rubra TaxID=1088767 RepID=UPI000A110B9B|nr:helix-turn-helix transcriptional regulator [Thermoactinospora rubra]
MTTSDLVGLRIKQVRRQRGLSQAQLAHPELSDSYISLIESGKRTPTPAVLELIAQKLDCSLSFLLNGVTAEQLEDIELALAYARLALENGEVVEARARFAELLANNNLTGLTALRQDTEFGLALATEACGDLPEAIAILQRLHAEDVTPEREVELALAMCRVYRESDQLTEAVEIGEQTLGRMAGHGWSDELVELGATLLAAYYHRGDMLKARQFAAELLNVADTLGTPRSLVAANWNAAIVAEKSGHGEEALALAERALAVQSETGHPRNLARLRTAVADLILQTRPQEAAQARAMLERVEREMSETSASTVDRARLLVCLATAALLTGEPGDAVTAARDAQALIPGHSHVLRAEAGLLLALALGAVGRAEEGLEAVRSIQAPLDGVPDSRRVAGTWFGVAETYERLGDSEDAVEAYRRALACAGL